MEKALTKCVKTEKISALRLIGQSLRAILPPYEGEPLTLYRGENKERYCNQNIGFCWSRSTETATMFARGLNSIKSGGLLISALIPSQAIIAGPNHHSIYLGELEYTIDPLIHFETKIIEEYPATH